MTTTNPFNAGIKGSKEILEMNGKEMNGKEMNAKEILAEAKKYISKDTAKLSKPSYMSEAAVSDRSEDSIPKIEKSTTPEALLDTNVASKEVTYTNEEVLPMLDCILNDGYAVEHITLRNVDVVIRTRFTWEDQYLRRYLESADLHTVLNYQGEVALVTLAASLVQFGSTIFKPKNEGTDAELKEFMEDRISFVKSLNSVLTDIVLAKLGTFDDKQRYIIAHFDELLKVF